MVDFYAALFWIGFFMSIASHSSVYFQRQHAVIALSGTLMMFLGSKLGREFVGIR